MTQIVAVHGVMRTYRKSHEMAKIWFTHLNQGLEKTGYHGTLALQTAYYADLLINASELDPKFSHITNAVNEAFNYISPSKQNKNSQLADWLEDKLHQQENEYWANFLMRNLAYQAWQYLHEEEKRKLIQKRLSNSIDRSTRVVIAHSLGSVVAYEYLCSHPLHRVQLFITMGSPLGHKNVIFNKLKPTPNEQGQWPGVKRWINVSRENDLIASPKEINPHFKGHIEDIILPSKHDPHMVQNYLSDPIAIAGIASYLKELT